MKKNSRIYIAGHTGFLGSALVRCLRKQGYNNLILKTHRELDLTARLRVEKFFQQEKPEYVFLMAARVGGIWANNTYPAEFIYQNLAIQNNVIDSAYKAGVKKLLFPGSACMYPKFCPQPMKPDYLLTGVIEPTNEPFAVAKIAGIKMCQAYNRQYKTNFISAVPATVYGPGDHFDKNGHVAAGLLERFYNAAKNNDKEVVIWGSGKPKREFIFIDDAADAFIFLMKNYSSSELINIGGSIELSVKALANKIKVITGFKGKIVCDTSKPDGILRRSLDSAPLIALGWQAKTSLDDGLKATCVWKWGSYDGK